MVRPESKRTRKLAPRFHRFDRPELTIRDLLLTIRSGHLDAVANRERAVGLAIECDALQPTGIVRHAHPVLAPDRHEIVRCVHVGDAHILAGREPVGAAAFGVAHHIAGSVLLGPLTVGTRHLLPSNQDPHVMLTVLHMTRSLHRLMDYLVQLRPRGIVRRDDEGVRGLPQVLARHHGETFIVVSDLVHATLEVELPDPSRHIATGQLLDDRFERRILLAHDGLEARGLHAVLLELLIGSARVYGLMLTDVAHQQDAVARTQTLQEFVHLLRARQARLVEHVEPFLSALPLLTSGHMALQGARRDARLAQFVRGARRRRQPFDPVAGTLRLDADRRKGGGFPRARHTFQRRNLIVAREDLCDRGSLILVQMRIVMRELRGRHTAERRLRLLAGAHPLDRLALEVDHLARGERATGGARSLGNADEFACVHTVFECPLDFPKRDVGQRPVQRITQQRPFIHDGVSLQVSLLRERHGRMRRDAGRVPLQGPAALLRGSDDVRRLVAEGLGDRSVLCLHLVMRDSELGSSGLMRRNLGGFRPAMRAFRELVLNLLPARARGIQVVLGVASDFGLAACAAIDFVPEDLEADGEFRPVHRRPIRLALIEFPRLQRTDVAVLRPCDVEHNDVGVKLGRGVAIDRSGAVVLELGRHPLTRGLGRMIAEARLCEPLEFIERDRDARSMRVADPGIAAHQRGQRNTLRGGERRIPPRSMRHRLHRLAPVVGVGADGPVAHELFAGQRILALRQPLKVLLVDGAHEAPVACELPVPLAADLLGARVVVVAGIGKLFLVIRARLGSAQRLRDGEHGGSPLFEERVRPRSG